MKVIVDKLPENPRECLFSQLNVEYGYMCMLRPYTGDAHRKPQCLCKGINHCDCLIELEEVQEEKNTPS